MHNSAERGTHISAFFFFFFCIQKQKGPLKKPHHTVRKSVIMLLPYGFLECDFNTFCDLHLCMWMLHNNCFKKFHI